MAQTQPQTQTIERTSLAMAPTFAVLRVQDYQRAKRFYQEKLGLEVEDYGIGAMATGRAKAGDGTWIVLYERQNMPAPHNTAVGFRVKDVPAVVKELLERGVEFEEYDIAEIGLKTKDYIAVEGPVHTAWFKDSEGNVISISDM